MIKLSAYAKFDLAIHIEPKKTADGYYPVHYIDCQIDLYDELSFESQKGEIEVVCDSPELADPKENFVYKTAGKFRDIIGRRELGAKITLLKNIPIRAGFGGGSSDGAATLLGLCKLWNIPVILGSPSNSLRVNSATPESSFFVDSGEARMTKKVQFVLDEEKITQLARELGKDFNYSLYGKLSEVVGKGKNYEVKVLSSGLPIFWLLVVVPVEEKPSTGWVYEHLKTNDLGQNAAKIIKLKTAILKRDKMGILNNLTNDFESIVSSYYPIIERIKEDLVKAGAEATIMAGSGLSVVGFFENRAKAQKARGKLKGKYQKVLIAKTIN